MSVYLPTCIPTYLKNLHLYVGQVFKSNGVLPDTSFLPEQRFKTLQIVLFYLSQSDIHYMYTKYPILTLMHGLSVQTPWPTYVQQRLARQSATMHVMPPPHAWPLCAASTQALPLLPTHYFVMISTLWFLGQVLGMMRVDAFTFTPASSHRQEDILSACKNHLMYTETRVRHKYPSSIRKTRRNASVAERISLFSVPWILQLAYTRAYIS